MTAEIIPFPTLERSGSGAFGRVEEIWSEAMPADAGDLLDGAGSLQRNFLPLMDGLRGDLELLRELAGVAGNGECGINDGVALGHAANIRHELNHNSSRASSIILRQGFSVPDMERRPLHETLRKARKSAGLTLAKVADAMGVSIASVQQWETGRTKPSAENLIAVMALYRVDLSGSPVTAAPEEPPSARIEELPEGLPAPAGRRDLPVKGIAVGGADGEGDFRFNGETVDYLPRPAMLAHRRRAFAVQVSNDSMYPRFSEGTRLYVDPDQHARPGDDVIVELHTQREGEAGAAYVKTLVKRTPTRVVVEQFNPPREIPFDLERVKAIYRVIPWHELLGV